MPPSGESVTTCIWMRKPDSCPASETAKQLPGSLTWGYAIQMRAIQEGTVLAGSLIGSSGNGASALRLVMRWCLAVKSNEEIPLCPSFVSPKGNERERYPTPVACAGEECQLLMGETMAGN